VTVAALPEDRAANPEPAAFFARALGVPRSDVEVTRGETSLRRTVPIRGVSPESVLLE
jgi:uncharacterized protein YggU (UPF0235/DUF167 family)